jgi:hypothetical protein
MDSTGFEIRDLHMKVEDEKSRRLFEPVWLCPRKSKNFSNSSPPRGSDEPLGLCPRTRHDLTVMKKTILEKEVDSTGFEPVAFTLQT